MKMWQCFQSRYILDSHIDIKLQGAMIKQIFQTPLKGKVIRKLKGR